MVLKCHSNTFLMTPYLQDDLKCSNGYCIRSSELCDGIGHCGNGDDETVRKQGEETEKEWRRESLTIFDNL